MWFLALDNAMLDGDGYLSRGSDYGLFLDAQEQRSICSRTTATRCWRRAGWTGRAARFRRRAADGPPGDGPAPQRDPRGGRGMRGGPMGANRPRDRWPAAMTLRGRWRAACSPSRSGARSTWRMCARWSTAWTGSGSGRRRSGCTG